MKAMIMAAGVGSRLILLTSSIPKPMVPIVNRPVMEYCVELLKSHGIKDIIANTHYKPEKITGYFKDGQDFGVNMHYSYEEQLLGTAGGVKNNRWFLDETFAIVSGDALTNINLTQMYKLHKEKKALATLALIPVEDVTQYGVVVTDEENKITTFQEKPQSYEALSNMVNTGIYIFEPEIFDCIPHGVYDFGKQLFPKLAQNNERIYGYFTKEYWCDVGSLEVYKQSNWDVLKGKFAVEDMNVSSIKSPINPDNDIKKIDNVVIGNNCFISKNVILKDCIIWDNCIIEDNVTIENAIIGSNCIIGENSIVHSNVVMGSSCIVGKNACLNPGIMIAANSKIPSGHIIKESIAG